MSLSGIPDRLTVQAGTRHQNGKTGAAHAAPEPVWGNSIAPGGRREAALKECVRIRSVAQQWPRCGWQ